MRTLLRSLRRDGRASVAVEFALVAPVMLLLCMGLGEICFQTYVQSVLDGEVQKAGRDGTIEDNQIKLDELDKAVETQMRNLVPSATFKSTRTNYDDYASKAGEPFTDSKYPNASGTYDGICNHGESYTDLNNNKQYDKSLGESGEGSANDVAEYTITMTYERLFPVDGAYSKATVTSSTLLKNQPYKEQVKNTGTGTGTCA